METFDRPGVHLLLKARMLKAEVLETMPHGGGCVTWSPNPADYHI